jgi:hypothetical protein
MSSVQTQFTLSLKQGGRNRRVIAYVLAELCRHNLAALRAAF